MKWLLFLVALGACATSPTPSETPSKRPPPVRLRPPSDMPGAFSWRQRVTVSYPDASPRTFDAVLEKSADTLSLVGLTPINTVMFVIEQNGTEATLDNRTGEALPFDATYVLRDVQRVFFPWLDGVRAGEVDGVAVTEEIRSDGRVVSRTFRMPGEGAVVVTFDGLRAPGEPPERAVLEDARYGYRLEIETAPALANAPQP